MTPNHELDRVRAEMSCVAILAARGIELRRCGAELVAPCPFHLERTPSFYVDPAKDLWLCRGACQEGGDSIRLLMKLDGLTFAEVLRKLGAREIHGGAMHHKPPRRPSAPAGQYWEQRLAEAAAKSLPEILETHRCDPVADFFDESPIKLDFPPEEDAAHFLRIFPPAAIVWTGELYDSGRPEHAKHFRPVEEWIQHGPGGSRIAAGRFKPGSISRSQTQLDGPPPFVVIECDDLVGFKPDPKEQPEECAINKALTGALARWLRDRVGLRLCAVVDSGGKSLHCWLHTPPAEVLRELQAIAAAVHIDLAAFDGAHCWRLPGFPHEATGKPSKILYLDSLS